MNTGRSFRPEFFDDVEHARAWYEEQRGGLGRRFVVRVEETIDRIADAPEVYGLVDRNTRVAVVHPFSYGVFFEIEGDEVLFLAVLHLHRQPGLWRKRR